MSHETDAHQVYREERTGMLIVRKSVSFRHVRENKGTSNDETHWSYSAFSARVWDIAARCVYYHDHAWRNQKYTNTSASVAKEPGRNETPDIGPSWPQQ